eukprot:COSAG03_NODE_3449_length_2003_cov_2.145483_4_plen_115_part_01
MQAAATTERVVAIAPRLCMLAAHHARPPASARNNSGNSQCVPARTRNRSRASIGVPAQSHLIVGTRVLDLVQLYSGHPRVWSPEGRRCDALSAAKRHGDGDASGVTPGPYGGPPG